MDKKIVNQIYRVGFGIGFITATSGIIILDVCIKYL